MKKFTFPILFFALLMCGISWQSKAQDIHFSQNYATPLLLNPAMTGVMNGDVRATLVYRNQWASLMPDAPFRTIAASAEFALPGLNERDRIALGLALYSDKGGDLSYGINYIDAAFAYNVGLSETTYFSLGLEGGVSQRSVDFTTAQTSPEGVAVGVIPAGLDGIDDKLLVANFGAGGLFYVAPTDRSNIYAGVGMYHFLRPNIAFTEIERDQLSAKISAQVGGSMPMGDKLDLVPSAYYIKQGKHFKLDAGTFFRFIFSRLKREQLEKAFSVGSWIRIAGTPDAGTGLDALVLATKLDYNNISLGLSYDLTLSTLSGANSNRGGVEIALVYMTGRRDKRNTSLSCPRF